MPEESDGVTYNYSCDLFQCELNSIVGSAQAPQRTLAGLGRGTTRPRRPGGACVDEPMLNCRLGWQLI